MRMSTGTGGTATNQDATTHQDLVELSGYHAYQYPEKPGSLTVNGKKFKIEDTRYDTDTGLDVVTVRNDKTGEVSIVFVGSDQLYGDWINTNVGLIGDVEPAQLIEAEAYYREMKETYGDISFVTGNSLAGALANRVAIDHPEVTSVTINPAMLPKGMFDPNKVYANITNYQSEYDVLTHVQEAIKYGDRVPGRSYQIKHGLPIFSAFIANHVGYPSKDENGEFTITIGKKGEPGYGRIHLGAHDHVVTSIWRGTSLHGGTNVPIRINVGDMNILADRLQNDVSGRLALAGEYIGHAVDIVEDENAKFAERVSTLQQQLNDLLDQLMTDPMFKGVSGVGNAIKLVVRGLTFQLNRTEEKLRVLNVLLRTAPVEVIEFLFSIDISVESLISPVRNYLNNIIEEVDGFIAATQNIIDNEIPALFEGGKEMFVDAVVGELGAHYQIIHYSKDSLLSQVSGYSEQVRGVADVFKGMDETLGIAIATNTLPPEERKQIPEAPTFCIQSSTYLEDKLRIKDIQVEIAHNQIKSVVTSVLTPILMGVKGIMSSVELGLEAIEFAINTTVNMVAYSPAGLVVDFFTDYVQKVRDGAEAVKAPIVEMKGTVANLKTGMQEAIDNLPELLDYFEKYIDVAIFTPSKFKNVQLYNIGAVAILSEMEMLFNDIVFQLSAQRAQAIEGTVETSRSILGNIVILREGIEKGTV